MLKNIIIDKNQREIRNNKQSLFGFRIGDENILQYQGAKFSYHWHREFELTYVYEGCMLYQVDSKIYTLKEGDYVFCNSNCLHRGQAINLQACRYFAITFNPDFLASEGSLVYQKYIAPIIYSKMHAYLFKADNHKLMAEAIDDIINLYQNEEFLYEIKILTKMLDFWSRFYECIQDDLVRDDLHDKKSAKIKAILHYIHQNYTAKLTLEDIARANHLSVSDCSHSFKQYLHETIFSYILRYRIEQSLPLLINQSLSITEIALAVGFNSGSYYTEIFKRYYAISPKQYQNAYKDKGEF